MSDMPLGAAPIRAATGALDNSGQRLQEALDALDAMALQFGWRGAQAAGLRRSYQQSIQAAAAEIRAEVERGDLTAEQGAAQARQLREEILKLIRSRDSELGRAWAKRLKLESKTLEELTERYAGRLFKKPAAALTEAERAGVMREIIAAAGRDNPKITAMLRFLGPASRGLVALSVGIAVYDIYNAPDRAQEALHQGILAGAGTLGSYAAGAFGTSLVCGPAAPVCVGIFVVVGGVGFTLGGDFFWRRLHPGDGQR